MIEIMDEYDKDSNKTLDFDEFQAIVSDSDVDMLLGVYWMNIWFCLGNILISFLYKYI